MRPEDNTGSFNQKELLIFLRNYNRSTFGLFLKIPTCNLTEFVSMTNSCSEKTINNSKYIYIRKFQNFFVIK